MYIYTCIVDLVSLGVHATKWVSTIKKTLVQMPPFPHSVAELFRKHQKTMDSGQLISSRSTSGSGKNT